MRRHPIFSKIARATGRDRVAVVLACAIAGGALHFPRTAPANELEFLRCVPSYAAGVVVTSPEKLIENPAFELMPTEVFVAASLQELGIDVSDLLEQAVAIVAPPRLDGCASSSANRKAQDDRGMTTGLANGFPSPRYEFSEHAGAGFRNLASKGL